MIQNNPVFGEVLDPDQVAALTGLTTADFDPALPIQVVSTGTAFAIVPLRSADALSRLNVRQHEATAFLRARGARWFYVLGPRATSSAANAVQQNYAGDEPPGSWQARMQFSGGEDPATGSAAGCAISHLVYYGAVAPDRQLIVHQGIEIKRPSKILLRASLVSGPDSDRDQRHVTNVGVGGSTVLVASGRLFLP
jgi:trans-2,3-dihydro-3-hydroxyanthranilate isomerase